MRLSAPGSPVDAYAAAVDVAVQLLLRGLRRLFSRGVSASDLPLLLVPVVSEAYLSAWRAAARFLVDEAVFRGADSLVYVPSPPVVSADNMRFMLRHLGVPGVAAGDQPVRDFKVTPESKAQVTRTLVKGVRDAGRQTVRRAAVESPGRGVKRGELSHALLERYRAAGLDSQADMLQDLLRQAEGVLEVEIVESAGESDAGVGSRGRGSVSDGGRDVSVVRRGDAKGGRSRVRVRRPVAWARVIRGEYTCGFCVMLASRGAAYRSSRGAGFNAHYDCDCEAVPVYDKDNWTGMRQADYLYKLWAKHSDGSPTTFTSWARAQQRRGRNFNRGAVSPIRVRSKQSDRL